jgi:hypothetical protein
MPEPWEGFSNRYFGGYPQAGAVDHDASDNVKPTLLAATSAPDMLGEGCELEKGRYSTAAPLSTRGAILCPDLSWAGHP